jgi:hypothetical protein
LDRGDHGGLGYFDQNDGNGAVYDDTAMTREIERELEATAGIT